MVNLAFGSCEILSFYPFDLAEVQRRRDVEALSILCTLRASAVNIKLFPDSASLHPGYNYALAGLISRIKGVLNYRVLTDHLTVAL